MGTDLFEPEQESSDNWPVRVLKFISIIVVLAAFCGMFLAFSDHLTAILEKDRVERDRAENYIKNDTVKDVKTRFAIGAGVGALIGMIYVGRCILLKKDP